MQCNLLNTTDTQIMLLFLQLSNSSLLTFSGYVCMVSYLYLCSKTIIHRCFISFLAVAYIGSIAMKLTFT